MIFSGTRILVILFCIIPIFAVTQPSFKELTINNGLPHMDAHYAVDDATGFIWFATLDGLCRYGGGDMEIYRNIHSNTNSISNNRINCLQYDDAHKGLWVGTHGGGLNFLNMKTGRFIRLRIKNNSGETLREITSLSISKRGV